jgi:hypothetical protein
MLGMNVESLEEMGFYQYNVQLFCPSWPRLKTLQSEVKRTKTIGFFKMAAV